MCGRFELFLFLRLSTNTRNFYPQWWFQQTNGDFGGMEEWRPCHQTINGSSSYCSRQKTAVDVFPSGNLSFLEGNPPLSLYSECGQLLDLCVLLRL